MPTRTLIACHDCDLLQCEPLLPLHAIARCGRCGAELYRHHVDSVDRSLACALGAIVLFAVANTFPIVGLKAAGDLVETTLLGGVQALYAQHMRLVAGLVLLTTIVTPLTELIALVYLLLPLKFNRTPPGMPTVFRTLRLAHAWSMIEVFMLGILVALAKLAHIATVVPGPALWAFGALMLLLVAASAAFDPRELWAKAGAAR
jgi:paraquat-inducible protein A